MTDADLKTLVKDHYAAAAARVGAGAPCCDAARGCDPISRELYGAEQRREVPLEALEASLGCGNPTALAELHAGEVVLDLGSGGGIDVLLSARRVGPEGKAYGLDMTDEMLALAEENRRRSGLMNVEFLRGEIEDIPLPEASVDVIISNCVINLATDKDRVFKEAHRVLRPGGRLAVSDLVLAHGAPDALRDATQLWAGCVAGALEEQEYAAKLVAAGFTDVAIEETRSFTEAEARDLVADGRGDIGVLAPLVARHLVSAFVRAVRR